jgi:predicted DNA-binding transcriptional regulator AlpA
MHNRMRTPAAAKFVGLSESTLEKKRLDGSGPRYSKLGKICVYSLQDLETWVASCSRTSTSEAENGRGCAQ